MAGTNTNTNTNNIIGFNLFDGVEIRGTGPAVQYPVLVKQPLDTAKIIERTPEGPSNSTLNVSLFEC